MFMGVDPGSQKFGWALTDEKGLLLASGIAPGVSFEMFAEGLSHNSLELRQWLIEGSVPQKLVVDKVFCGDGTGHAAYVRILKSFGVETVLVDERNTTLEARSLYWKMHPPKGFWRLVPVSLRTPPRNVDDLAACCIVRRGAGES